MRISYNKSLFRRDFIAALTVYVMLVPQAMAYAMLAGVPPVMGLYAATIPLILYALFASSKHLSVGPVAISSLLIFSSASVFSTPGTDNYIAIVLVLTLTVGAIQLLLGLLKIGFIVKFIPQAVLGGYTSAAAIVIAVSQLKHIFGLELGTYLQVHLVLLAIVENINRIHLITTVIGLVSIASFVLFRKWNPRLPAAVAIFGATILMVYAFQFHEAGVKIVGAVPSGFPTFTVPTLDFVLMSQLFWMALTIALIGFMESLAIAKTIAKQENDRILPNQELKALGIANIIGSFFQSFAVNGSFSRSAVNHQAGGATQVTSVLTAILVMITLLFFTSLFYYLPQAVLAAMVIVAVSKLVNLKELQHFFRLKPLEGWSWLVTFFITLFVGIQWGIIAGVIFTLAILLKRATQPNIVEIGYVEEDQTFHDVRRFPKAITSEEVLMVRIDSTLHFANIAVFEDKLKELLRGREKTKWIMLDMSGVNEIDVAAVETLEELLNFYKQKQDIMLLFVNMKGNIRDTVSIVGWDRLYPDHLDNAKIEQLLRQKKIVPLVKLDYFL